MRTLFENGSILTMNAAAPHAEALLMNDGRIEAVGTADELQSLPAPDRVIDLARATLLPGFIDSHSHIWQCAQSLCFAQLQNVRSFEELLLALRQYMEAHHIPKGAWVIGTGYDPERLAQKTHPTAEVLDAIDGHPVMITADSGHMGCLNSQALRLVGITEATDAPQGGVIGRYEDGRPNGYLEEAAFTMIGASVAPPTPDQLRRGFEAAQRLYLSHGVTTAQEGLMQPADMAMLAEYDRAGTLLLDVVGYADLRRRKAFPYQEPNFGLPAGRFRIGGYKLMLDGSPQGRTAWLTKPYQPLPSRPADECGYPTYADEQVRAYVELAEADGMQLLTHCNGDAAIDQLLDAHQSPSRYRNVIIHAQLMRLDQLPTVKRLCLMPSYFVAHVCRYGDVHLRNLGVQRASLISPVRSTAALGIPYTLHQDTPVMPPDMLRTLYAAVCRRTDGGMPLGVSERVTLHEALMGVTVYGAYQYFEEADKGMLKAGMRADLAIVEGDLLRDPPESLKSRKVLSTYKDGQPVYRRN